MNASRNIYEIACEWIDRLYATCDFAVTKRRLDSTRILCHTRDGIAESRRKIWVRIKYDVQTHKSGIPSRKTSQHDGISLAICGAICVYLGIVDFCTYNKRRRRKLTSSSSYWPCLSYCRIPQSILASIKILIYQSFFPMINDKEVKWNCVFACL